MEASLDESLGVSTLKATGMVIYLAKSVTVPKGSKHVDLQAQDTAPDPMEDAKKIKKCFALFFFELYCLFLIHCNKHFCV